MTAGHDLHRERRRHPRALTDLRARVTVGGGASCSARVINLSMGGALLSLGDASLIETVTAGDVLALQIGCRGYERSLRADARVVPWNRAAGRGPLVAVQFGQMGDEDSELLEELMSEALSELRGRAFARML